LDFERDFGRFRGDGPTDHARLIDDVNRAAQPRAEGRKRRERRDGANQNDFDEGFCDDRFEQSRRNRGIRPWRQSFF